MMKWRCTTEKTLARAENVAFSQFSPRFCNKVQSRDQLFQCGSWIQKMPPDCVEMRVCMCWNYFDIIESSMQQQMCYKEGAPCLTQMEGIVRAGSTSFWPDCRVEMRLSLTGGEVLYTMKHLKGGAWGSGPIKLDLIFGNIWYEFLWVLGRHFEAYKTIVRKAHITHS